jgi:ABC-type lipoprotein release transport system permease subunit
MQSMERNILDFAIGDIQVFSPGYRDKPSLFTRIEHPGELLERLTQAGIPASARLRAPGLGASGETSAGMLLIGIDVERDAKVSLVYQQLSAGSWLKKDDPRGVVLGRRLARTLGVKAGDELVFLGQASDGSLANDLFIVRGILKGVTDETDRVGAFVHEKTFRELMVMPDGAHQMVIRRPAGQELGMIRDKVKKIAAGLEVKTWRELVPTLASMLDSTQGMMMAMFFIVYIAIGFVILNAMLMAVFERVREFGVLKALGVGPGGVFRLIVTESAMQTGLAIVAGSLLSLPLINYLANTGIDLGPSGTSIMGLAWDPVMRAVITRSSFTGPIMMLAIVVGLAILYPALKAAWIRPIRAMHHR